MKQLLWGLLLAMASLGTAHADSVTFGGGPIRESDGVANYKTLVMDYQFSKYVEGNFGEIIGWSPNKYVGDLNTQWLGVSLVRREEDCTLCMVDSLGYVRLSQQTHNLTSPYQFYICVGLTLGRFGASYRHLSNAHTGGANFGEDFVIFSATFEY